MSDKRTVAEYSNWRSFCSDLGIRNFLDNPYDPVVEILQVFVHRIKNDCYSKKSSVRADTLSSAWQAIATNISWKDYRTPVNHSEWQQGILTCA